jgi:hypothetical protein
MQVLVVLACSRVARYLCAPQATHNQSSHILPRSHPVLTHLTPQSSSPHTSYPAVIQSSHILPRSHPVLTHLTPQSSSPHTSYPAVIYSPGQQYNSHCDGDCSDRSYQNGKRTASSLVYCTVADKGGATSFTKVTAAALLAARQQHAGSTPAARARFIW